MTGFRNSNDGLQSPVGSHLPAVCASPILIVASHLVADLLKSYLSPLPMAGQLRDCRTVDGVLPLLEAGLSPELIVVVVTCEPGLTDALSAIQLIRPSLPGTKWLLIIEHLSPERLRDAVSIGIDGFLSNSISGEVFKRSIELMLLGQSLLPAALLRLVQPAGAPWLSRARAEAANTNPATSTCRNSPVASPARSPVPTAPNGTPERVGNSRNPELSDREQQVLDCLVDGQPNKVIGRTLNIAEATVKVHIKGLLRKMQVANRTQAAVSAMHSRRQSAIGAASPTSSA
jgi:two-component system nitrate/nitrite response regulator NarL